MNYKQWSHSHTLDSGFAFEFLLDLNGIPDFMDLRNHVGFNCFKLISSIRITTSGPRCRIFDAAWSTPQCRWGQRKVWTWGNSTKIVGKLRFFWWVMFWIMFLFWINILNSKLVGKKSLQTISTNLGCVLGVVQALPGLSGAQHSKAKLLVTTAGGSLWGAPFLEKLMLPTWIRNCETNLKSTNIVWLLGNDVLI